MRRLFFAAACATVLALVLAGGVSAGGGTGITATHASTQTFDAGTRQATFVRSASDIINETNRIGLSGTPQNGWSSEDVWIQFRPTNNPYGNHVVPNPACESTTVPGSAGTVNGSAFAGGLAGSAGSGYFIPGVIYNVCVYFVHTYAADLSVAPNPVVRGNDVVFTSHLLVDGTASATPPATIVVHAYGTDSTCTTEAGYGPFSTTLDGTKYVTDPKTASAAPGDYYYRAEATFATPTLTRWSSCTKLTIWPVVTVDLAAAPNPVVVDNTVVFTSHVKFDGVADTTTAAANVKVHAFGTDSTCTGSEPWGPFDTSVSGSGYVTASLPVSLTGTYYYETVAATAYGTFTSGCTALVITPHVYTLSLLVNGDSPSTAVAIGGDVDYTGTALLDGNPVVGTPVNVAVFTGFGCVTPLYPTNPAGVTDGSGNYLLHSTGAPEGLYSAQASTASATSNCVDITVGDNWSLTLSIVPASVIAPNPVTLLGTLSNTGVSSVAGRTVTIVAYGTDNTCTTPAWGPWTPTTDGSGDYTTGPVGTGGPPADYYYKATSMGVASGCEHFTITS